MAHTLRFYFLHPLLVALPTIATLALLLKMTVLLGICYTY